MTEIVNVQDLKVGSSLVGRELTVTAERQQWYGDGLFTAGTGVLTRVGVNIHTDDEYAKSQHLPGAIADGMQSTNWITSMLIDHFGEAFLTDSKLRTTYIKPTFVGSKITPAAEVTEVEALESGATRVTLDVYCKDAEGTKRTVGEAVVIVPRTAH
jgi:C4-type Zn-finger protein